MRVGPDLPPQVGADWVAAGCIIALVPVALPLYSWVCAASGAGLSTFQQYSRASLTKQATTPPGCPLQGPCTDTAPWCAFQSGYAPRGGQSYDFSHSRLAVYNATHLRWQQYSSSFGRVVDEWWLVRHTPHGPFTAPA